MPETGRRLAGHSVRFALDQVTENNALKVLVPHSSFRCPFGHGCQDGCFSVANFKHETNHKKCLRVARGHRSGEL